MQTEALIRALVADARPVRRLPRAALRCALWLAGVSSFVAGSMWLLGVRSDLDARSLEPYFLLENLSLLAICVLGASSGFRLSVPGGSGSPATLAAPLAACAGWVLLVLVRGGPGIFESSITPGLVCVARALALAAMPVGSGWAMLRAAAPQAHRWTGLYMALSASSLGAFGMQMHCAVDRPAHVLVWHCLPVLLLGPCGAGLGRAAFARRARPAPAIRNDG